jgi:hypothetical protein
MSHEVAAPGPHTGIDPALEARLGALGRLVRLSATLFSVLALLGLVFPVFAEIPPGPVLVRHLDPASGLSLTALSIAALLAGTMTPMRRRRAWRRVGLAVSFLVAAFGVFIVVIFLGDRRDLWWGLTVEIPAFSVGIVLFVLGLAIPLSASRVESRVLAGQVGALLTFSLTAVIFLGYAYGDPSVGRLFLQPAISVQASLMSVLIAFGVFLFRPSIGLLSTASSPGAGGKLLRRFGPPVLLVPAVLIFVAEAFPTSERVDALAFIAVGLGLVLLVLLAVVVRAIDQTAIEAATSAAHAERARIGLEQEAPVVSRLAEVLHVVSVDDAEGWDVATRFRSGRGSVAGDASGVRTLPDGSIGVVLVDITGHGAEPAIRAVAVRDLLLHSIALGLSPADAMSRVHWHARPDSLASAIVMRVVPSTGSAELSSAGHPPSILVTSQTATLVIPTGALLFLDPSTEYESVNLELGPGDAIVLFSDGVADVQRSANGRTEPEALAEMLVAERGVATRTADLVLGFADAEPSDDQTVVVLRRSL